MSWGLALSSVRPKRGEARLLPAVPQMRISMTENLSIINAEGGTQPLVVLNRGEAGVRDLTTA
jgi:hypothetical protein